MLSLILSIHITATGLTEITIPPTDPTHIYYMETSTNLVKWDNTDAELFIGSYSSQLYFQYPPRKQEFFRVEDLGPY